MVPFKLSTLNKLWGIVRVLRGKMTLIHELFLVSSLKPVFTPTFLHKNLQPHQFEIKLQSNRFITCNTLTCYIILIRLHPSIGVILTLLHIEISYRYHIL